ncbi:MAG: hypothetical protein AMXMBFR64_55810 [Myxococcales bacterium]
MASPPTDPWRRFGPLAVAVLFALLAWWTWGAWPDVLVDFGRELYVPWQLSEGAVLHRDLAWFNGPLSQHFNAAMFRLAGASLSTLVWTNLVLLAALVALWWSLLARLAGALAATVACCVLLCVFGFAQLVGVGNYNFVTPYSHEITHGLLLGTGALWASVRWDGSRAVRWAAAAGLLLGLCFLTKVEVFLASALGVATALALAIADRQRPVRGRSLIVGALLGTAALPVVVALVASMPSLGLGGALRSVFGPWAHAVGSGASDLAFYRSGMGIDEPGQRMLELLAWTVGWVALLGPLSLAGEVLHRRGLSAPLLAAVAFAVVAAVLLGVVAPLRWQSAARPLPLFMVAVAAHQWVVLRRGDPREAPGTRAIIALCVFALAMLLKMLLRARVYNYGFALALPATLVWVTALVGWWPRTLSRRAGAAAVLRAGALAVVLVGVVAQLGTTRGFLHAKTVVVGSGGDSFRADSRGELVNHALETIATLAEPGATLAVLPEGVMLNYLSRRTNPTPYVIFMPLELVLFGEEAMVARFDASPPDWIVLVHKDTSEYGYPLFGVDYAVQLRAWVRDHYEPVRRFGQEPLVPGTVFGVQVLRRRI